MLSLVTVGWTGLLAPTVDLTRPSSQTLARGLDAALAGPLAHAPQEFANNPEWALMANLYEVLGRANLALAEPSTAAAQLERIDARIDATLAHEAEAGAHGFLLPYAQRGPFSDPAGRSVFVDGEIAMMLAARLHVAPSQPYEALLRARVEHIDGALARGPMHSAESYPNECWTFCNTTALAALVLADRVLGTDHQPRVQDWLRVAKSSLVEPSSGLLVSSYTWDGTPLDGPEGSSIWMVAHNLQLLDPAFAQAQYAAAKGALAVTPAGFAWAREWPRSTPARPDVDSGLVVPGLDASPGASGLAVLGAAAFDDAEFLDGLLRSMEIAAAPGREGPARWHRAAGRIGNAVVFYALNVGPLWAVAA